MDALGTLAPLTGEFVTDRTATILDAYTRAFGGAATTVAAMDYHEADAG